MNDIAIGISTRVPNGSVVLNKPSYLIYVNTNSNKKHDTKELFLTIDKPELLDGFINVKGMFVDAPETEVIEKFSTLLTSAKKELFLELLIPVHRVHYIRSLVFRAK